jgi:hypothetical protein
LNSNIGIFFYLWHLENELQRNLCTRLLRRRC